MSITFDGNQIYGIHGPIIAPAPQLQVVRSKFAGVRGSSEITLETGERELRCESWLCDNFNASQLQAYLIELEQLVGTHGDLVYNGIYVRTYKGCTFEGFSMDEKGPLPDEAGTLGTPGNWWCAGVLRWTQLSVWGD